METRTLRYSKCLLTGKHFWGADDWLWPTVAGGDATPGLGALETAVNGGFRQATSDKYRRRQDCDVRV